MISIIVPIYNSEKYLDECLQSILNQTFDDYEVICVDDGSTDKSLSICQKFANADTRFKLIGQENGGVSAARNRAIKEAKGEYICFVDSDDIIGQEYLSSLFQGIQGYDISVIGYTRTIGSLNRNQTNSIVLKSTDYIKLIIDEKITHPQIVCMLYKSSIIRDCSLSFYVGCVRNEDAEFYIKYLANTSSAHICDYVGYYYRDNSDSAVHKFNEKSLTFIEADRRISAYLSNKSIYPVNNYIMSSSVQYFVFKTARQKNQEIYNLVHERYEVRNEMKKMLHFPRFSRKIVSLCYLLLGKHFFYRLVSMA